MRLIVFLMFLSFNLLAQTKADTLYVEKLAAKYNLNYKYTKSKEKEDLMYPVCFPPLPLSYLDDFFKSQNIVLDTPSAYIKHYEISGNKDYKFCRLALVFDSGINFLGIDSELELDFKYEIRPRDTISIVGLNFFNSGVSSVQYESIRYSSNTKGRSQIYESLKSYRDKKTNLLHYEAICPGFLKYYFCVNNVYVIFYKPKTYTVKIVMNTKIGIHNVENIEVYEKSK